MSEEKAHAELSASGSDRWLNCPGSVALIRKAPPEKESPYAEEGTKAHALLELWLTHIKGSTTGYIIPKQFSKVPGMVDAVRFAIVDVQKNWRKVKGQELLIERKVSLEKIVGPDMFGTADIGIVEDFGRLEINDYKHGAGVRVEVEYIKHGMRSLNTQLVYYALGLAAEFDFNFDKVTLKITQPRCNHPLGPVRATTVDMKELLSYVPLFKKGVERTEKKDAKRIAGPWCKFCKAKIICKEGSRGYKTDSRSDF